MLSQIIKDDNFESGDCTIEGAETVPIGEQGTSQPIVSLQARESVLRPLMPDLLFFSNNRTYLSGRAHAGNRLPESTRGD